MVPLFFRIKSRDSLIPDGLENYFIDRLLKLTRSIEYAVHNLMDLKVKVSKLLPFLFLLFAGTIISAQDSRIDSMVIALQGMREDTVKVNTMNEIAAAIYRTDPDKAISYSQEAKALAEQLIFPRGLALAYKNIGLGYYMQGNYVEASKNWEPSMEIYQELGDDQMVANILNNLGSVYVTIGQKVLAIQMRGIALSEALSTQKQETIELAMFAFGVGSTLGVELPFSRTHESEADELGLYFMAMAGYNPQTAPDFWERMSAMSTSRPPEFLSMHPDPSNRIANLKRVMPKAMEYYNAR
jgi:tetratricopeptide (TPR) repeat protein